jgi:hypothetical protein
VQFAEAPWSTRIATLIATLLQRCAPGSRLLCLGPMQQILAGPRGVSTLMATTASPRSASNPALEDSLKTHLRSIMDRGFYLGKGPLFVLGAGISAQRVPFIDEMAGRLVTLIRESVKLSKAVKAILIRQGELIQARRASRSDAAEFFSTCQMSEHPIPAIWQQFCLELALDGLPASDGRRFTGLFRLTAHKNAGDFAQALCGPSKAHLGIANLLTAGACHVLNLNYDPLLFLAMSLLRRARVSKSVREMPPSCHIISLHTEHDIRAYYSSVNQEYQPCVVNARGDIFYARCTNDRCPDFGKDHSLDTRYAAYEEGEDEAFRCSSCHLKSIQLQLSFPGYETKERLVEPILHQLRDFLGHRVCAIVPIGLSGQWDPYLLSELFDWSLAYSIPIIDVKPAGDPHSTPTAFEAFRHRYFPSIPVGAREDGPWYEQWASTADEFMEALHPMIQETKAFELAALPASPVERQALLPLR